MKGLRFFRAISSGVCFLWGGVLNLLDAISDLGEEYPLFFEDDESDPFLDEWRRLRSLG